MAEQNVILQVMTLRRTGSRTCLDVVIFDSPRAWTAYLMRQIARHGFHPKCYRTATGFDLVEWSATMAVIFDVEDASPGSPRVSQATQALARMAFRHPEVCRVALAAHQSGTEWLLREAGAIAVYHSIFDVPTIIQVLRRQQGKRH